MDMTQIRVAINRVTKVWLSTLLIYAKYSGNSLWHPGAPAPGLLFDFSKFENASEKSEKNWTQTYVSSEHSCNFDRK